MRFLLSLSVAFVLALSLVGCKSQETAWHHPMGGTQQSSTLNLPTREGSNLTPVASVGLPGRFPSQVGLPTIKHPVNIQGNATAQTIYGNAEAYQQLRVQRAETAKRDQL